MTYWDVMLNEVKHLACMWRVNRVFNGDLRPAAQILRYAQDDKRKDSLMQEEEP